MRLSAEEALRRKHMQNVRMLKNELKKLREESKTILREYKREKEKLLKFT